MQSVQSRARNCWQATTTVQSLQSRMNTLDIHIDTANKSACVYPIPQAGRGLRSASEKRTSPRDEEESGRGLLQVTLTPQT